MPVAKKSEPAYCVVYSLKNKGIVGARVLSRGEPFLTVDASLGNKKLPMPLVGQIIECDMTDADKGVGTADILDIITDAKELKKLRKEGSLPAEEDYAEFVFIKETHEDKKAKTHDKKSAGGQKGGLDNEGAGAPAAKDELANDEELAHEEEEKAAKKEKKKEKKEKASSKSTTPEIKPSAPKMSLEDQMAKLNAREGNADLDDI